jgi:hypothetical protein
MSSIDTFKDALCAMTAEQTEDVGFSSLDNTVSSKRVPCSTASNSSWLALKVDPQHLTLDASATNRLTWATDYDDQG